MQSMPSLFVMVDHIGDGRKRSLGIWQREGKTNQLFLKGRELWLQHKSQHLSPSWHGFVSSRTDPDMRKCSSHLQVQNTPHTQHYPSPFICLSEKTGFWWGYEGMAYLSKFLPKALIILLLFLYVMTFLILVREECSVTNGVKNVWKHSRQAACWGR